MMAHKLQEKRRHTTHTTNIRMIIKYMFSHGLGGDFGFFFQAEDGIRDAQESRGLGDVYKRQDYQGISV